MFLYFIPKKFTDHVDADHLLLITCLLSIDSVNSPLKSK